MRPFRNRLSFVLVLSAAAACVPAGAAQPAAAGASAAPVPAGNPWFPLAVGNTWSYRCSVEGTFQFTKTVKITARVAEGGRTLYRAEQRVGKAARPLVYFLGVTDDGTVFKTLDAAAGTRESLIGAAPKPGERVGERTVAASEKIRVATVGKVDAFRVENYPLDDPKLTPDQKAQWQARFYARGYGPVAESDGLGGECLLSRAPVIARP